MNFSGSPDGIGTVAYPTNPGTGLEWVPKFMPKGTGDATTDATSLAVLILRGVINMSAGAVVGVALAPGRDKRVKYGIVGGLLGGFFGPLGIGAQALYVLTKE